MLFIMSSSFFFFTMNSWPCLLDQAHAEPIHQVPVEGFENEEGWDEIPDFILNWVLLQRECSGYE